MRADSSASICPHRAQHLPHLQWSPWEKRLCKGKRAVWLIRALWTFSSWIPREAGDSLCPQARHLHHSSKAHTQTLQGWSGSAGRKINPRAYFFVERSVMILLWSSLSLKHLAGTIKAVLVQTQPYVHLNTEVSFQSAEVFGGTSVKGWEGFPRPSAQQVLFLSDPCVVSKAEPDSSHGTISVRCCSKG